MKLENQKFGYTMIELLVTIGIIGLISSIVLANYPKFSEQLSVSQTAHAIALAFREAKTYALAVRQYCPPGGGACSYNIGYGVHFDISGTNPENFILYVAPLNSTNACATSNCAYSSGYEVDTLSIKPGISIARICNLSVSPADCKFNKLDVAYARPDPAIYITGFYSGGTQQLSNVGVVVRGPGGNERTINVWTTGQISVQ